MAAETLILTVSLKIPDNEARSALEALQAKMGLADSVRDLAREDVWELRVTSDEDASGPQIGGDEERAANTSDESAVRVLKRIVETTNLFANPNKHRYSLAVGTASQVELEPDQMAVLVSDREGSEGESMVASLRGLNAGQVVGARRWVRWRVTLGSPPAREDATLASLLRKIAVADARDGGLFCNPHIEQATAVLPWGDEKVLVR